MPSARLAMAVAARWLEPPSSCDGCAAARSAQRELVGARPPRRRLGRRRCRTTVGDRRQPVLELGVEAVLRVAGLQVEEAEDQRAGEAEQRGREGGAHAGERRRRPCLQLRRTCTPASPPSRDRGLDGRRRPSRSSRAGPRTCRAGRGRPAGRRGSARCRGSRRGAVGDRIEDASASSRSTARCGRRASPSSAPSARAAPAALASISAPARKELTQRTSRNSRDDLARRPAGCRSTSTPMISAVEAGVGQKAVEICAVEDGGDEAGEDQEDDHPDQDRSAAGVSDGSIGSGMAVARHAAPRPGARPRSN